MMGETVSPTVFFAIAYFCGDLLATSNGSDDSKTLNIGTLLE
jgi:hypothetical protein